jgi:L-threonylcarbamoyladenylate synthase
MSERVTVDVDKPAVSVLRRAAEVIRNGGLVVYPTETLYGIGSDALNKGAVRKVLLSKKRRRDKAPLVIVDSPQMLLRVVERVGKSAQLLMNTFWPGPLTLVFNASALVPDEVTQGRGTIGVRIPSSTFCLKLLAETGVPLTSTSANLSGEPPGRTIEEIQRQLPGVDLFLDAGELPPSLPSTVVDVSGENTVVLREGVIPFSRLQQVLPAIQTSAPSS